MWLIIFGISIAAVIAGLIYMMSALSKFPGIQKISKGRKLIGWPVSFLDYGLFYIAYKCSRCIS